MKGAHKDEFNRQTHVNGEAQPDAKVTTGFIRLFRNSRSRMKSLVIIILIAIISMGTMISMGAATNWRTDFTRARETAKTEHKYILLNFSGSDWCVPCIKTKKEIFDNTHFNRFADSNLVLVNADFPRLRKNDLSTAQKKENEALAEKYDKEGAFPFTLLLDANGTILKEWKGYPGISPENFVNEIRSVEHKQWK